MCRRKFNAAILRRIVAGTDINSSKRFAMEDGKRNARGGHIPIRQKYRNAIPREGLRDRFCKILREETGIIPHHKARRERSPLPKCIGNGLNHQTETIESKIATHDSPPARGPKSDSHHTLLIFEVVRQGSIIFGELDVKMVLFGKVVPVSIESSGSPKKTA